MEPARSLVWNIEAKAYSLIRARIPDFNGMVSLHSTECFEAGSTRHFLRIEFRGFVAYEDIDVSDPKLSDETWGKLLVLA